MNSAAGDKHEADRSEPDADLPKSAPAVEEIAGLTTTAQSLKSALTPAFDLHEQAISPGEAGAQEVQITVKIANGTDLAVKQVALWQAALASHGYAVDDLLGKPVLVSSTDVSGLPISDDMDISSLQFPVTCLVTVPIKTHAKQDAAACFGAEVVASTDAAIANAHTIPRSIKPLTDTGSTNPFAGDAGHIPVASPAAPVFTGSPDEDASPEAEPATVAAASTASISPSVVARDLEEDGPQAEEPTVSTPPVTPAKELVEEREPPAAECKSVIELVKEPIPLVPELDGFTQEGLMKVAQTARLSRVSEEQLEQALKNPEQLCMLVAELDTGERTRLMDAVVTSGFATKQQADIVEMTLKPGGFWDAAAEWVSVVKVLRDKAWIGVAVPLVEFMLGLLLMTMVGTNRKCGGTLVVWLIVDGCLGLILAFMVYKALQRMVPAYTKFMLDPRGGVELWTPVFIGEDCDSLFGRFDSVSAPHHGISPEEAKQSAGLLAAAVFTMTLAILWSIWGLLALLFCLIIGCFGFPLLFCFISVAIRLFLPLNIGMTLAHVAGHVESNPFQEFNRSIGIKAEPLSKAADARYGTMEP